MELTPSNAPLKYLGAVGFALVALVGCATVEGTPTGPAVLEVVGKMCTEKPSLEAAVSLTPKKPLAYNTQESRVFADAPCLNRNGKGSNYVVFALPAAPQNHTITIGGQKEAQRAFAPSVSILDASGVVIRDFPRDRLANIGTTFAFQFRPSAEARYILVQSDPELVGKVMSAFETNLVTGTGYGYTGVGATTYTTYSGNEGSTQRSFSHEGLVSVFTQAVTGKIGLPAAK